MENGSINNNFSPARSCSPLQIKPSQGEAGHCSNVTLGFHISHNLTRFVGVGGYLQETAPQKFQPQRF